MEIKGIHWHPLSLSSTGRRGDLKLSQQDVRDIHHPTLDPCYLLSTCARAGPLEVECSTSARWLGCIIFVGLEVGGGGEMVRNDSTKDRKLPVQNHQFGAHRQASKTLRNASRTHGRMAEEELPVRWRPKKTSSRRKDDSLQAKRDDGYSPRG